MRRVLPVRRELQPVGTPERHHQRLGPLLRGDIDNRDAACLSVGHPQLPAVRRQIKSFGTGANGNNGDVPIGCRRRETVRAATGRPAAGSTRRRSSRRRTAAPRHCDLLENADGRGRDIRREQALLIAGHDDHVRAVLTRADHPVDSSSCGIVSTDDLRTLCREVDLPASDRDAMRPAERTDIDGRQRLPGHEIDHGNAVREAVAGVVVRDVRQLSVRRGHHLVRIGTGGSRAQHFQCCGVDDRQRVVALVDGEQQVGRRGRRRCQSAREEREEEMCESIS